MFEFVAQLVVTVVRFLTKMAAQINGLVGGQENPQAYNEALAGEI